MAESGMITLSGFITCGKQNVESDRRYECVPPGFVALLSVQLLAAPPLCWVLRYSYPCSSRIPINACWGWGGPA